LEKAELLPAAFFGRDTREVSRDLIGKILVVRGPRGALSAVRIIETEAYRENDPASHSCRGRTPRAAVMFGPPGLAHVYLIYGMYRMLNFVTEPEGIAGAVLIRSAEPLLGEEKMAARRKGGIRRRDLTSGPGKLCEALGIRMTHNGQSLQGPLLEVCDDGYRPRSLSTSPRVGISSGRERLWRYFESGHDFVSRAPENSGSRIWREGL
jgi:DNA-3-methyladenine glycosylase